MNLSLRRGSWAVTLPLAAGAVAYLALWFLPGMRGIADIRQQVRGRHDLILQSGKLEPIILQLNGELEEAAKYVENRKSSTPPLSRVAEVYAELHRIAEEEALQIRRFEPDAPVDYETLRKIRVFCGLRGSLTGVYRFLDRLEGLPWIIWADSVELKKPAEEGADLDGELKLVIFAGASDKTD